MKTIDIAVKPGKSSENGPQLKCGLHQFMYVHGDAPVELEWGEETPKRRTLLPGDSMYVSPMTPHRFGCGDTGSVDSEGRVYIVRIPGQLTSTTWKEFSAFEAGSRQRVGKESMRWYN